MKQRFAQYGAIGFLLLWSRLGSAAAFAGTNHVAWGSDFDGDGRADPAVVDETSGHWQVLLSMNNYAAAATTFDGAGCLPGIGDYDGDRKADPVLYDSANGIWAVMLSASGYDIARALAFGGPAYVPAAGDFDGDGLADPAVYQETTGNWHVMLSGSAYGIARVTFGGPGYQPAVDDYDGDGKADPAVYLPAVATPARRSCASGAAGGPQALQAGAETAGQWQVMLSAAGYAVASLAFGGPGCQSVAGDFDGDGKADPATYRETDGTWNVKLSLYNYALVSLAGFGGAGDTPAAGDYDGDGKTDPAYYRESEAMVEVYFSGGNNVQGSFQETNTLHAGTALGSVTRVNDQDIGLLYGRLYEGNSYSSWWYQVISHDGSLLRDEPVYYDSLLFPASASSVLAVDAAGEPHVFTGYYSRDILRLYRSGSGWTNKIIGTREEEESDILARIDGNGAFHVLTTSLDTNSSIAMVHYYSNRSGTWQKENVLLSLPLEQSRWSLWSKDLAIDGDGNAHVVLSLQRRFSNDVTWPGWIYYLSNRGGTWFSEVADQQSNSSWDSFFPRISLAVDTQGRPAVAAWLKYNVLTGSDALSQLLYCYRTAANSWTRDTLAETADNYFGSDGGNFTGLYPKLALDNNSAAHIIFSDLASSHINGYESAAVGQIRYASNASGGWTLATLFRQSAAAWEQVYDKYLLVSGDGRGMDVVARILPADGDYIVHFSSIRQTCFYFK